MKVAVVYSEKGSSVLNVLGMQNEEFYLPRTVSLVVEALRRAGHTAEPIVADRHLLDRLDNFLPRQGRGEITGMVFNLALGIQGKCRYTHVPAMLEMAGVPYTGSSPMGHALALNKVVAKQIFIGAGIPTPRFTVVHSADALSHDLTFPLVVKPESEAGSFGVSLVEDQEALRHAVAAIVDTYKQPALIEEFIAGREVNISLYGNQPPTTLPILELQIQDAGPNIFTHDLKFDYTGRVKRICPPELPSHLQAALQQLAVRAFDALNIYDYARVDIRLDEHNQPWVLELNSMASINPTSSFVYVAKVAGLDYDDLINTILESACARYSREEPGFYAPRTLTCEVQSK